MSSIGEELLNVPIDKMISSMASGIAKAQYNLDQTALKIAQMMGKKDDDHIISFGDKKYSLLELGFTPTFYNFVDSLIEVKVAISIRSSQSYTASGSKKNSSWSAYTSSVNARYTAQYSYSSEGSSLLRTKIVPVPPPGVLEQRIQYMIDNDLWTK